MLKTFFKPYGCRCFSNSRLLRNAEKEKDIVKSSETPENVRPPGAEMDFAPSDLERTILVLSGKYPNKASIPNRISFSTMDNARSRLRIRGANILMVGTLFLCGYYVWQGKKRAKAGESFNTIYSDMHKKPIADTQLSK